MVSGKDLHNLSVEHFPGDDVEDRVNRREGGPIGKVHNFSEEFPGVDQRR